jgi:glycolate oxidase subunit GlcD
MESSETSSELVAAMRAIVGEAHAGAAGADLLADATEQRGFSGAADAVAAPRDSQEVAAVLRWCYEHDVSVTPRGGGTGLAGGAVPLAGGVVLDLRGLDRVRSFDPLLWRINVEAGVTTAEVRRRARENGLLFPVDPGAGEQSTIGGNVATNAGGPHAFRYGVTGAWVTGLEAVVPPGELVTTGGPVRKHVAGLDLRSLLVGSEGVLGIVTAVWLRLMPAPEAALPVVAVYDDLSAGAAAIETVLGSGIEPAMLEFLDAGALGAAAGSFPGADLDGEPELMLIAEADGAAQRAESVRGELLEALAERGRVVHAPVERGEVAALWRWRDGVSHAVAAARGGKLSEDIVVPVERLVEAIGAVRQIGDRAELPACSWGHAGDGNLHATFLVASDDRAGLERAESATEELFELADRLGGALSGEHGVGALKRDALAARWTAADRRLHEGIKAAFDPKGLLNPGKLIG